MIENKSFTIGQISDTLQNTKILTGFMKKVGQIINGQISVAITLRFYRLPGSYLKT